jgi:hypothetical protein
MRIDHQDWVRLLRLQDIDDSINIHLEFLASVASAAGFDVTNIVGVVNLVGIASVYVARLMFPSRDSPIDHAAQVQGL